MKLRRISTTSGEQIDLLVSPGVYGELPEDYRPNTDVFGSQPTTERTNEQRLIDKYGSLENARCEYERDEYDD